MYAVIKTGGRQQKVRAGEVIEVDFMEVDPGSAVEFDPVLIVDDDGKPHVGKGLARARVVATLLGDKKSDKIRVFKYRPKSGYRRTQGHRQLMTVLEIQEVVLSPGRIDRKGVAKPAKPERAEEAEAQPEAEPEPQPEAELAQKPAAKKPAAKKPAVKKPAVKKPAAKKPAKKTTRKASAKKTATRKSTGKGPSSGKPSSEKSD